VRVHQGNKTEGVQMCEASNHLYQTKGLWGYERKKRKEKMESKKINPKQKRGSKLPDLKRIPKPV